MSKKKTALSKAVPEETKTAADEVGAVEKEPQEAKASKKMYVGPTIAGFAVNNTVYDGIPDHTKQILGEHPELNNLFIEVVNYPKANRMMRERQGYIYSAYLKALELRKH